MSTDHEFDLSDDSEMTSVASRAELNAALAKRAERIRPYLVIVQSETSVGRQVRLEGVLRIGRSASAEIRLDEDGVSRNHAKLVARPDGGIEIADLGSTNGTWINGERVTSHILKDGDKIQIGNTTILKFSYQDAIDEALQKNLYESATRDGLTKLHNKKSFAEALTKEFAFAVRHRNPLSLVLFDIDHFKKVNDTHGHPAGDFILQTLAAEINGRLRVEDLCARWGGEEFAILMRDTRQDHAMACAERLRASIESYVFTFDGKRIPVTISMGVATVIDGNCSTEAKLLEVADKMLYRAKQGGRNRVAVASPGKIGDGPDDVKEASRARA